MLVMAIVPPATIDVADNNSADGRLVRLIVRTRLPFKIIVLLTDRVPMVELTTPTARVPPDWTITGPARTPVTINVPPVMSVALV